MFPEAQPQTVKDCAALQRECAERQEEARKEMYRVMATNHKELMDELIEVKEACSYAAGKLNGKTEAEHDSGPRAPVLMKTGRFPWREIAAAVLIIATAVVTAVASVRSTNDAVVVKAVAAALEAAKAAKP